MNNNQNEYPGKLIFEIEGKPQKKGWLKKTKSHLAFYENVIVIEELGDYIEIWKKNIANIHYTAPMVGDYECVTVEISHYDEGELNAYPLDEDTWNGIFARIDQLLDNEWNKFRKAKTEVPNNVKWFNAINAVVALAGEGDAELFGGDIKSPETAVTGRETLYDSWGVNIKQDLLDQIDELCAGQQSKNAIAWDLVRMIRIASLGYLADYLSYDEAVGYCSVAGKKIQNLFHSWDDMFINYMQGYAYWSGEDPKDEESETYKRLKIYEWLKKLPKSPYRIDWYTNIE